MRHFTLPILSLGALALCAQPTITAADAPAIGEQFTYVGDGAYVVLPAGGSDQTWDFSGSAGTPGNTLNTIAASAGVGAAAFPTANVALATSGFEEYIGITTAGLEHFGQYTVSDNIVYTDPELYLPIPCTYGNTWNDDFAGVWGGGSNTFTGTNTASASGFGSLVLPWGTVNNVLRIDLTQTRVESNGFSYVITANLFYRPGTGYFLANNQVNDLYIGTALINSDTSLTYLAAGSIGLDEARLDAIGIDVAPNPATDQVSLVFGAAGELSADVIDMEGRIVMTRTLGTFAPGIHREEMDISALPAGVYAVRITNTKGEQGVRRLVVE